MEDTTTTPTPPPPHGVVYSRPRARRSSSQHQHHHPPPPLLRSSPMLTRPKQRRISTTTTTTPPPVLMRSSSNNSHDSLSSSSSSSSSSCTSPSPPSLSAMAAALLQFLLLYWKHYSPSWQTYCRKIIGYLACILGALLLIIALSLSLLWFQLWTKGARACRVERTSFYNNHNNNNHHHRPLVEYYVHGHGNGHAARTLAVVEDLNRAGIDVRLFLGRASLWNVVPIMTSTSTTTSNGGGSSSTSSTTDSSSSSFLSSSSSSSSLSFPHNDTNGNTKQLTTTTTTSTQKQQQHHGTTTVIAVTSIVPSLDFWSAFSHSVERILGDCEVVSQQQKTSQQRRPPLLVVADGDMPGMIRAKLGGIPSVGFSHGQSFHIGVKPHYISQNVQWNRAWDQQDWINRAAVWFSKWQIGVNVVPLETRWSSAAVARPPLRRTIRQLRRIRQRLGRVNDVDVDAENDGNETTTTRRVMMLGGVRSDAVARRMANLVVYGRDEEDVVVVLTNHTAATTTATTTSTSVLNNNQNNPRHHHLRKLVLCYFRDHNGDTVARTLLEAGFDVLLFDSGNYRNFDRNDRRRYGSKWIVSEQDRLRLRREAGLEPAATPLVVDEKNGGRTRRRRLSEAEKETAPLPPPRLIRVTDRMLFVPFMSIADGIASSAGSQLMSECIYADIPLLALYRPGDNEQMLNVEMIRHARQEPSHATSPLTTTSVFGDSLEHLSETMEAAVRGDGPPSSLRGGGGGRRRENRTMLAQQWSSELEGFVAKVHASTVSQRYWNQLEATWPDLPPIAKEDDYDDDNDEELSPEEDPFRGMPDAAAILLEIIKQEQAALSNLE